MAENETPPGEQLLAMAAEAKRLATPQALIEAIRDQLTYESRPGSPILAYRLDGGTVVEGPAEAIATAAARAAASWLTRQRYRLSPEEQRGLSKVAARLREGLGE